MKKFYCLETNDKKATLSIYGDITSYPIVNSDVSAFNLTKELDELDVDFIDVYINSYGGEVAEGLAIYNALKRHKAKVTTYVDGFACSIASVIAMAGDERIMYPTSLLMIHNCWTMAVGNADELRKSADDLDKIMTASINAYMDNINISEDELKELLANETFLNADDALEKGFITSIGEVVENIKHNQLVRQAVMQRILKSPDNSNDTNKILEKLECLQRTFNEFVNKNTQNSAFSALENFSKKF